MASPSHKLSRLRSALKKSADFLRKQFRNPLPRIFPGFHRWSKFRRLLLQNLLIGIFIQVIVLLGTYWNVSAVVTFQNTVLDSMMKLSADTPSEDDKHPTQVFIDVNEQTYRSPQWGGGEPSAVPLDKIADLIKSAFANGARYVLVDFTIDGTSDERQKNFITKTETILKQYPQGHLLFVRTLRQPLEPFTAKAVRPSTLDALIAKYPGNVHAVAPNFLLSSDHVVRHWRLWESACYPLAAENGAGRWVILPSPQLMIVSLEKNQPLTWPLAGPAPAETLLCAVDGAEPEILDQAQSALIADWHAGRWVLENLHTCYQQDSFTESSCSDDASAFPQPEQTGASKKTNGEILASRILFRLPDWVRKHTESVLNGEAPTIVNYGPNFDRVSALNILTGSLEGPPAIALAKLKNAGQHRASTIAVIGASYQDSRDIHLTPLGEMPGSLVLVNAIDTLQTTGILQTSNPWLKVSIIVLIIIGASTAFALLSTLRASILMIALIALTMGPLSYWLLKQGIWLDFGAPIIGIYLHRAWENFIERRTSNAHH
jgi:CHASE2 domain-containing sensor protein